MLTLYIPKRPPLIVYEDDADLVFSHCWTWHTSGNRQTGHYVTNSNGQVIGIHRWVLARKLGKIPSICDHINGLGNDNRRDNLREATGQQNQINRFKQKGDYTSKYKGVRKSGNKRGRGWRAQIYFNSEYIHLGMFHTEIGAAKAYNKKAIELFGEFARLNTFDND